MITGMRLIKGVAISLCINGLGQLKKNRLTKGYRLSTRRTVMNSSSKSKNGDTDQAIKTTLLQQLGQHHYALDSGHCI